MSTYIAIPSPEVIHKNAVEHGWYEGVTPETLDLHFIPAKLALIHSEISEALEVYRKFGTPAPGRSHPCGHGSFGEELADAVIRILDLAGFLDIDLEHCILAKHEYNKTRPYRHGGKTV